MQKTRIVIEEFRSSYSGESKEPKQDWFETDTIQTTSAKSLAGFLRAKADEIDPPGDGKVYR